jgi:hypothetical protein
MTPPMPSENLGSLPTHYQPLGRTASNLADFHLRRGKRTGNCTWSMPDGMTTRSLSRTGCGKARRRVEGWIPPPGRESDAPLQKPGPPSGFPVFCSHRWRSRASSRLHFLPSFFDPSLCVTAPLRRWAPLPTLVVRSAMKSCLTTSLAL